MCASVGSGNNKKALDWIGRDETSWKIQGRLWHFKLQRPFIEEHWSSPCIFQVSYPNQSTAFWTVFRILIDIPWFHLQCRWFHILRGNTQVQTYLESCIEISPKYLASHDQDFCHLVTESENILILSQVGFWKQWKDNGTFWSLDHDWMIWRTMGFSIVSCGFFS